ncbi:MAG TPA: ATP-binding cassette domain-containing protein, partial [Methanocorpusculum sp.]|nr:ATP-binding cassette domain-containing protein [Methanocorpusculum sp.]
MQKTRSVTRAEHEVPASTTAPVILDHVGFTYQAAASPSLDDVSLTIREGEFVVINGPSGSGKTTFARAVSGVLVHAYGGDMTGSITIAGKYADE